MSHDTTPGQLPSAEDEAWQGDPGPSGAATSEWSPSPDAVAVTVLLVVLALLVGDLVGDALHGVGWRHLAFEGLAAFAAAGGLLVLGIQTRRLDARRRQLDERLVAMREEAEHWRGEAAELLSGLRAALARQLASWQLSPAEREVALLLLQGLSHKQIAARRGASERTVRQQAHLLYRKVGLTGRAELAAFFLGALLSPSGDRDAS